MKLEFTQQTVFSPVREFILKYRKLTENWVKPITGKSLSHNCAEIMTYVRGPSGRLTAGRIFTIKPRIFQDNNNNIDKPRRRWTKALDRSVAL